jgi:chromosome segregation ATPase
MKLHTKHHLQIMKHTQLIIAFLSVAAFAVGCKKEQTVSEQLDQVKTETTATAQEMKDYTFGQKNEFVSKMQSQLDALKKDLEQLSAKIESSSDAVKAEAKPKLQALRDETTQLNKQLDNARNATESTWDSVKEASQKALDSLKDGFQQSRQWISDKIAP